MLEWEGSETGAPSPSRENADYFEEANERNTGYYLSATERLMPNASNGEEVRLHRLRRQTARNVVGKTASVLRQAGRISRDNGFHTTYHSAEIIERNLRSQASPLASIIIPPSSLNKSQPNDFLGSSPQWLKSHSLCKKDAAPCSTNLRDSCWNYCKYKATNITWVTSEKICEDCNCDQCSCKDPKCEICNRSMSEDPHCTNPSLPAPLWKSLCRCVKYRCCCKNGSMVAVPDTFGLGRWRCEQSPLNVNKWITAKIGPTHGDGVIVGKTIYAKKFWKLPKPSSQNILQEDTVDWSNIVEATKECKKDPNNYCKPITTFANVVYDCLCKDSKSMPYASSVPGNFYVFPKGTRQVGKVVVSPTEGIQVADKKCKQLFSCKRYQCCCEGGKPGLGHSFANTYIQPHLLLTQF